MSELTYMRLRRLGLAAMAAGLIGMTGCASTGNADLDALRSQVEAASADAAAAKADAAAAKATAADALRTANEAKAMSQDTEERIDRMFKKAMHK